MDAVAALAVLLSAAGAALFAVVGRTVQRRQVSAEARSAQGAFVAWWYGLAAVSAVGAGLAVPGLPLDLTAYLVLSVVLIAVLCAALAGLLHYLVFLYTNRNLLPALVAGYFLFFLLLVAFILQGEPTGLQQTPRGPEVRYAEPVEGGPLYVLVVALLVVPPVAASLAYLSLYWKTDDPVLKRRILLVSLSIAVWFTSSLVGLAPGAKDAGWWILTSHAISLAAAATILYAYRGLRPANPQGTAGKPAGQEPSLYEGPQRRLSHVRSARSVLQPA